MNYLRQKFRLVLSRCYDLWVDFANAGLLRMIQPSSTPSDGSYTTTDSGDGNGSIPMLNTDVPDISVIRVSKDDPNNKDGRDVLQSTTMELSPDLNYEILSGQLVDSHVRV